MGSFLLNPVEDSRLETGVSEEVTGVRGDCPEDPGSGCEVGLVPRVVNERSEGDGESSSSRGLRSLFRLLPSSLLSSSSPTVVARPTSLPLSSVLAFWLSSSSDEKEGRRILFEDAPRMLLVCGVP
jgi:hypothetical protein